MKKTLRNIFFVLGIIFILGECTGAKQANAKTYTMEDGTTYTLTGKVTKEKFKCSDNRIADPNKWNTTYVLNLTTKIKASDGITKHTLKRVDLRSDSKSQLKKIKKKVGKTIQVEGFLCYTTASGAWYSKTGYVLNDAKILEKEGTVAKYYAASLHSWKGNTVVFSAFLDGKKVSKKRAKINASTKYYQRSGWQYVKSTKKSCRKISEKEGMGWIIVKNGIIKKIYAGAIAD